MAFIQVLLLNSQKVVSQSFTCSSRMYGPFGTEKQSTMYGAFSIVKIVILNRDVRVIIYTNPNNQLGRDKIYIHVLHQKGRFFIQLEVLHHTRMLHINDYT